MKVLLIGMDGAHREAFNRGWTPFLNELVSGGNELALKEDLISRGWSEVVTGEHGLVTGALYDRADLDGTHGWSLNFKLADIPGIGEEIKPIWQVLNERGYKVGVMNVPTAFPAPPVDGFFVSGGGGGGGVNQDASLQQCHPKEILNDLHNDGYIVDERLGSLLAEKKLYKASDFFDRLCKKNNKRTNSFIRLAEKFEVDFGFVVYKSSSNIAEFTLLPALEQYKLNPESADMEFIGAVKDYYRNFDNEIKRLVESFPSAEIILVSDHSMAVRRWLVNANSFLVESGFQIQPKSKKGLYTLIKGLKKYIPFSLRQLIRNNKNVKHFYESMAKFDVGSTQAFSITIGDWNHGIFVNDAVRFGGPVPKEDIKKVAERIVGEFNRHESAARHGLTARVKPSTNSIAGKYFPDVIIDVPDGYFTSDEASGFITKFHLPDEPIGIKSVTKGSLLCGKGHHPLAINANRDWQVVASEKGDDLRKVNQHILKVFE